MPVTATDPAFAGSATPTSPAISDRLTGRTSRGRGEASVDTARGYWSQRGLSGSRGAAVPDGGTFSCCSAIEVSPANTGPAIWPP